MYSLLVNDRKLENVVVEGGFQIPSFNFESDLLTIPGRAGAVRTGRRLKHYEFEIPLIYKNAHAQRDASSIIEEITTWINHYDAVPIQFTDKNWYWKAHIDGPFNIANNTNGFVLFSILIKLADPYKYGNEQSQTITGRGMLANEGTADTYPIIKFTAPEDMTRLRIENRNSLTRQGTPRAITLGRPITPAQTPIEREQLVMHDTMRSTDGWQEANVVDNGHIAGEMTANTFKGFYASLYGHVVDAKQWQGPSLQRAIGQPVQDFRADILIQQLNVGYETGMIEVYFRDANGNRVAKIGFEDAWVNATENQAKISIGRGGLMQNLYAKADRASGWNDFDGIMRIQREGRIWSSYFAQIINGRHDWVKSTMSMSDYMEEATNPVTHVQVALRKYPLSQETDQSVKEIKVFKLNKPDVITEVPYAFRAGDEVEIDVAKGKVYVNGELRSDLIDLSTDFFSLVEGLNQIHVEPGIQVEASWKNRYL